MISCPMLTTHMRYVTAIGYHYFLFPQQNIKKLSDTLEMFLTHTLKYAFVASNVAYTNLHRENTKSNNLEFQASNVINVIGSFFAQKQL